MGSRWLLEFEARNPQNPDADHWKVGISERKYRFIQNHGHEKELARILLVEQVLEGKTDLLYEGWNRPNKEKKCYVYAGIPDCDYKSLTIQTNAPKRSFFLVFVLPDGTIDHWTWRQMADTNDGDEVPSDIKGELLWPRKQL